MQTTKKTPSRKTTLFTLAVYLLVTIFGGLSFDTQQARAASNEFIGTVSLDDSTLISAASIQTIDFTPATALVNGGSIMLTYPSVTNEAFTGMAALVAADVAPTQTNAVFGTATFDTLANTITIPITTAGTGAVNITVGATSKLSNPATPGQYTVHIATKNASSQVVDTGYAVAFVGNTGDILITIDEVMLFTITSGTNLNFKVDPSVNGGVDQSQATTLHLATNAANYSIAATMANAQNANKSIATGSGGAGAEISGTATTENTLSFNTTGTGEGTTDFNTANNIAAGASGLTNDDPYNVYYDLNVDYTVDAGTYTGTITYTAMPAF